jgi:hypothetical protein
MLNIDLSDTFGLGTHTVKRLGYGAMQLAGPGVFGPPKDPDVARAVLREAVESGVNHIDTSDFVIRVTDYDHVAGRLAALTITSPVALRRQRWVQRSYT